MKRGKKIGITILVVLVTIVFVLPMIAFGIVKWGILPPEKLTPLVVREVNKLINGELECEKIELTYFETYPRLGIKITNGTLVSYATRDSISIAENTFAVSDSLLSFRRAIVSVNPTDYLFRDKITIGEVILINPDIYAYMNEEGIGNWEVYVAEEDTITQSADTTAIPPIDLQKVRIRNGHMIYDDRQEDMYVELDSMFMKLDGNLTEKGNNRLKVETHARYFSFDHRGEMYAEIDSIFLKLDGVLSKRGTGFAMESNVKSIYFESPNYTLENNLAIGFKSKVAFASDLSTIRLKEAEMMINSLPFTADGKITNLNDSTGMQIDMDMQLKVSDLNDLLAFVPEIYLKDRKKIQAKGSVLLETSVHGIMNDSIMPTIDLSCKVENGSYYMKGVKQGIDAFAMDMNMHLNGVHPDSSFVNLEHLHINGLNTSFNLKGKVEDMFRSPFIDATMKGNIDFTRLAKEFLNPDTLLLDGNMIADLTASFRLDDLIEGKYNNVRAAGSLNIEKFRAISRPTRTRLSINGLNFSVDSVKQTSSFLTNEDLLSAFLTVDSLNIRHKREMNTTLSGIYVQAKTSPTIDTTAVIPLTTHIKIERLRTRLPDSVWVVARNSELKGGIRPSASNKQVPNLAASITVDTLRYMDTPSRTGVILASNTFNLEALPYRDAMRQQTQRNQARRTPENRQNTFTQRTTRQRTGQGETNRTDRNRTGNSEVSTQERVRNNNSSGTNRTARNSGTETLQDSVNRRSITSDNSNRQSATEVSGTSRFLRNWEVRGSVQFNQLRIFSRYFPLPMRMEGTSIRFATDNFTLKDARFHAGKSNFVFNGELSNIRRAVMRGGQLTGNFSINSEYIDCNQLINAMNRGLLFAENQEIEEGMDEDTFADMSESALEQSIGEVPSDSTDVLFVVPKFLDIALKLDTKKIDYKDLNLENVQGEMAMKNQSLNLKNLNMDSNIGSANLTMVYTAKDRIQASTGFELKMDDILVDKLIDLFPAIDSLLPMLRSFEGVVDCQMAATCNLDSTMSVEIPSLHAACYLHGENMVLLDGETFTEISKTLMFKNKNKNLIDSISVDLLIKDEKIEVYPFLVEMDRYRVAVGGEHYMDMTFAYHLSVLKSPIPFKLGLDIKGDLDNFKFKLVKCRYKDIFKPAREAELDMTRTNLRKEIRDVIRNDMLANAPELAKDLNLDKSVRTRVRDDGQPRRSRNLENREAAERERREAEAAGEIDTIDYTNIPIPEIEDDEEVEE